MISIRVGAIARAPADADGRAELLCSSRAVRSPVTPLPKVLGRSRLFADCDAATLATLARSSVQRTFARGDFLFRRGEQALHLVIIGTGLVKIVRRADASDSIVALFGPRETIGSTAVVGRSAYPGDAVAATDGVGVVCVGVDAVHEVLARDPRVAGAMNQTLVQHSEALHAKIAIMSAGSVDRRLGALLFHLLERFGDEAEDGTLVLPVVLTRGDLASLVGTTVESATRTMSRWQKADLVRTTGDGFEVPDLGLLRTAVGIAER